MSIHPMTEAFEKKPRASKCQSTKGIIDLRVSILLSVTGIWITIK